MKNLILAFLLILLSVSIASAQIGRGGGGARGGANINRGGGGAAARPQVQQRPSFTPQAQPRPQIQQRPQMPQVQRPATPNIQRPSMPNVQRPATPSLPNVQRPSVKPGLVPQTRPNLPTTRPNLPGGATTLPATRPNLPSNLNPGTRPNLPNLPDTRPNLPGNLSPGTRPNLPDNRPNLPGNLTPGTRPNLPDTRPNLPGNQFPGNRPNLPDTRPNLPNIGGSGSILKPGVLPARPDINPNNRPDWVNRPNNNNGNFNNNNIINNRPINNNFNTIAPTIYNPNRPYGNYMKPYYGGVYRPYGYANYGNQHMWGNYYAGRYYGGWHGGYWGNCFHYPPGFIARPVPLGWLLPATVNWNYFNPYWNQPATVVQYVNYSQPLPVESQTEQAAPIDTPVNLNVTVNTVQPGAEPTAPKADDATAQAATAIFDTARGLFIKGDYATAELTIDKAIAKLPQDPTLHEFRALTLFAQGKYGESAAAIYAVLAAGPGWNADTLYALYPDKLVFANQLATLEKFAAANPTNAAAFFLLGYEYLTLDDKQKAISAFDTAYKIEPKDELSKVLAENLKTPAATP